MRFLYYILVVVGACGLVYFGWSHHRVSPVVLMDDQDWPRQFPYPDGWLLGLNNWYDARYPAPRGAIKLHSELDRVRFTTLGACAVAATVLALGAVPLTWPQLRWGRRRRGFHVLSNAAGSARQREGPLQ